MQEAAVVGVLVQVQVVTVAAEMAVLREDKLLNQVKQIEAAEAAG